MTLSILFYDYENMYFFCTYKTDDINQSIVTIGFDKYTYNTLKILQMNY